MQTIAQATAEALKTLPCTTECAKSSDWRPTLDAHNRSLVAAADAAARFIADMAAGAQPYWLTFSGQQGVGKTMLARQIFERARDHHNPGRHSIWQTGFGVYDESNRRPNCVWLTANGFKDRMLGGDYDLPEYLRQDFLVVIDDLGAARDTRDNALSDGLYRLADRRIGRWMVWTTNLTLREIAERLDPRISSRLIRDDNRLVRIEAPDYALRRHA